MDPNLRTLSLSTWMSLPNLNFDEWARAYSKTPPDNSVDDQNRSSDLSSVSRDKTISEEVKTRALVASVAEYYENYVHLMNLDKFFRNDTVVVNIRPIKENEKFNNSRFENARWVVHG